MAFRRLASLWRRTRRRQLFTAAVQRFSNRRRAFWEALVAVGVIHTSSRIRNPGAPLFCRVPTLSCSTFGRQSLRRFESALGGEPPLFVRELAHVRRPPQLENPRLLGHGSFLRVASCATAGLRRLRGRFLPFCVTPPCRWRVRTRVRRWPFLPACCARRLLCQLAPRPVHRLPQRFANRHSNRFLRQPLAHSGLKWPRRLGSGGEHRVLRWPERIAGLRALRWLMPNRSPRLVHQLATGCR
mmetsp:Transcript_95487/g.270030  ORF Transcript_95487/g.270030 Transcript_95487/m.270030 type:complete len:242 (-) Transcript_95487:3386-4111(-)